ncbi:zinc finger MYM-type protein 1-like [Uloborus diversus]|uniref:zinc finger MYM-type protein 1-like n=1 Tax=Uloborus diversus TaxID=327109 RepID=UPI00240A5F31|nr:zinc finger MYM-type protein 1-like [Uloborus diversus]
MEEGLEPLPVPMEEKRFNDISSYVNRKLSNEEKLKALAGLWEPDKKYVFPAEDCGRFKRHFQTNWLMQFKWLAYSDQEKGTFCKFCVLFCSEDTVGKGKHVMIGKLVSKPCKNLKDSLEIFRSHERTSYHQNCMLTADSIRSISEKETEDIAVQVDNQRKVTARKNRAALVPISQTIRLCGKQQIALRGHQDSGRITLEDPEKNDGNFRALLRYRAAGGDVDLRQHLVMSAGNAMYTSPRIQNEIINTFGDMIQMQIRDRVHKSGLFSVLADETTDIAGIQQFSLCVRYLEDVTASVREDFLCFVPVNDVTGKGLCTTIKDTLSNLGIDLHHLRGQGYDGASAMRGEFRGVQAIMKQTYPKALYTHCASHSLNLCLSDGCKSRDIRNMFAILKEICTFFKSSSKRSEILKKWIKRKNPETNVTKLKRMCETRWVLRHEAIVLFKENVCAVVSALEEIGEESSTKDSSKAQSLLNNVCNFSFLLSLFVASKLLS